MRSSLSRIPLSCSETFREKKAGQLHWAAFGFRKACTFPECLIIKEDSVAGMTAM